METLNAYLDTEFEEDAAVCREGAAIEDGEAPESYLALWLHRIVTVALWVARLAVAWVAFRPVTAWEATPVGSLPGVSLHGTLTLPTVALMLALGFVSWAAHDLVDRFER